MDRWDVITIRTHLPAPERSEPRGKGPRMIHPTQAELADMLGVSVWTVRHWEQGVTAVPPDMAARMNTLREDHDRVLLAAMRSAQTMRGTR